MEEKICDKTVLDSLAMELYRIINEHRNRGVPNSAMIGILELIKYEIIKEAMGDDDE